MEDQAIGRVFRMGQSKNVSVVRYVMETSVEEVRTFSSILFQIHPNVWEIGDRVASNVEGATRAQGRSSLLRPGALGNKQEG